MPHKDKECSQCGIKGHQHTVCRKWKPAAPNAAAADTAAPSTSTGLKPAWLCMPCNRFMDDSLKQCGNCKAKRLTDSPITTDPFTQKKIHVDATQRWCQHDGSPAAPHSQTDQDMAKKTTALKAKIADLERHEPKNKEDQDYLQSQKAQLQALEKKPSACTETKDRSLIVEALRELEEKYESGMLVQKRVQEEIQQKQDDLIKHKDHATKSAKEEYDEKLRIISADFQAQEEALLKQKQASQKKIQDLQKHKQEKEQESQQALKNLEAVAGPLLVAPAPAAAAAVPGGTSVSIAAGSILHSNNIDPTEMANKMVVDMGITKEQAELAVKWSLTHLNTKALHIPQQQALAAAPCGSIAEGVAAHWQAVQQEREGKSASSTGLDGLLGSHPVVEDDDVETEEEMSEAEVDLQQANLKPGETAPMRKKVKRHVNKEKREARKQHRTNTISAGQK